MKKLMNPGKKNNDPNRIHRTTVYFNPEEREAVLRLANEEDITISGWIRLAVRDKAGL